MKLKRKDHEKAKASAARILEELKNEIRGDSMNVMDSFIRDDEKVREVAKILICLCFAEFQFNRANWNGKFSQAASELITQHEILRLHGIKSLKKSASFSA